MIFFITLPLNAPLLIFLSLDGVSMTTILKLLQLANALLSISMRLAGKVTQGICVAENALEPISFSCDPFSKPKNDNLLSANAFSDISCNDFGKETFVTPER